MLDRGDAHVAVEQRSAEHGVADIFGVRAHVHRLIEIGATKHDAGIDRGRTQHHQHFFPGVKTYAGRADGVLESTLSQHERGSKRRRPYTVSKSTASL